MYSNNSFKVLIKSEKTIVQKYPKYTLKLVEQSVNKENFFL